MINKYAEIYKRAQLYKAARGILRTKLAFGTIDAVPAWDGRDVLKAYNSGNLTENMSRLVYKDPRAYGITPDMGALTNFDKLPGASAASAVNATGQTAVNATGQTAVNATGQTAANAAGQTAAATGQAGGYTRSAAENAKRIKGLQASRANIAKQLARYKWALPITATALAIPAAYGTYKFFGGGQPQPQWNGEYTAGARGY